MEIDGRNTFTRRLPPASNMANFVGALLADWSKEINHEQNLSGSE